MKNCVLTFSHKSCNCRRAQLHREFIFHENCDTRGAIFQSRAPSQLKVGSFVNFYIQRTFKKKFNRPDIRKMLGNLAGRINPSCLGRSCVRLSNLLQDRGKKGLLQITQGKGDTGWPLLPLLMKLRSFPNNSNKKIKRYIVAANVTCTVV